MAKQQKRLQPQQPQIITPRTMANAAANNEQEEGKDSNGDHHHQQLTYSRPSHQKKQ
jgi:hypothetical protein